MMNSNCNGLYGFFRGGKQGLTYWFCLHPDLTIRRAFDSFYDGNNVAISKKYRGFEKINPCVFRERGLRSLLLGENADITKASTLWDWAAVFCFEKIQGRNAGERVQMDALLSP